jgi:hypothetical protein
VHLFTLTLSSPRMDYRGMFMLDKPSAKECYISYEKTYQQRMCSFCDAEFSKRQESL